MAKRAARASLAGGVATANVWEVERRELPFIALPRLPASHCACVLFAHFVSFSSCNNRSGNWHQRTKQPPQGHTAGPGVESRAVSSAKLCSFCWATQVSWGQHLLEMDKKWAQL